MITNNKAQGKTTNEIVKIMPNLALVRHIYFFRKKLELALYNSDFNKIIMNFKKNKWF
jgi:hypothetical protein